MAEHNGEKNTKKRFGLSLKGSKKPSSEKGCSQKAFSKFFSKQQKKSCDKNEQFSSEKEATEGINRGESTTTRAQDLTDVYKDIPDLFVVPDELRKKMLQLMPIFSDWEKMEPIPESLLMDPVVEKNSKLSSTTAASKSGVNDNNSCNVSLIDDNNNSDSNMAVDDFGWTDLPKCPMDCFQLRELVTFENSIQGEDFGPDLAMLSEEQVECNVSSKLKKRNKLEKTFLKNVPKNKSREELLCLKGDIDCDIKTFDDETSDIDLDCLDTERSKLPSDASSCKPFTDLGLPKKSDKTSVKKAGLTTANLTDNYPDITWDDVDNEIANLDLEAFTADAIDMKFDSRIKESTRTTISGKKQEKLTDGSRKMEGAVMAKNYGDSKSLRPSLLKQGLSKNGDEKSTKLRTVSETMVGNRTTGTDGYRRTSSDLTGGKSSGRKSPLDNQMTFSCSLTGSATLRNDVAVQKTVGVKSVVNRNQSADPGCGGGALARGSSGTRDSICSKTTSVSPILIRDDEEEMAMEGSKFRSKTVEGCLASDVTPDKPSQTIKRKSVTTTTARNKVLHGVSGNRMNNRNFVGSTGTFLGETTPTCGAQKPTRPLQKHVPPKREVMREKGILRFSSEKNPLPSARKPSSTSSNYARGGTSRGNHDTDEQHKVYGDPSKNNDVNFDEFLMDGFDGGLNDEALVSCYDHLMSPTIPVRENKSRPDPLTTSLVSSGAKRRLVVSQEPGGTKMSRIDNPRTPSTGSSAGLRMNTDQTRPSECPICLEHFGFGLSQRDINQHISKCEQLMNDDDDDALLW